MHHLVDLARRHAGVLEGRLAGRDGALDQILDQSLELGARQLHGEVLGAGLIGRDEGQVDFGLLGRGKLDLGLFGGFLEALQGQLVFQQIDGVLLFELRREIFDDALVEVLAAEEGVAVRRLHLEHAVADLEDRNIEGAAAEVIDRDGLAFRLLQPVGERGRGRLVDDAQDFEAGDLAGVLGGLALGVVEIGRDRDDRLGHRLAEELLGGFLHLLQDEGGNLARAVFLAPGFDPGIAVRRLDDLVGHHIDVLLGHRIVEAPPDQALDGEEGIVGIGDRLALGRLADEPLAVFGKGDLRGRGAHSFRVLDDPRLGAFHDSHAGIGGAKVDADYFCHDSSLMRQIPKASYTLSAVSDPQ